jgi:hypothetical protein
VGQQVYRSSANDPQTEVAAQVVSFLNAGVAPQQLMAGQPVDMATSLSTYVSVFDKSGNVLVSTARLNNKVPSPPKGILETANLKGENIVTWQPQKGVRCAAVILPYKNGTVLVARSLRLTEQRIAKLGAMVLVVWVVTMVVVAFATALVIYLQWNAMFYPK